VTGYINQRLQQLSGRWHPAILASPQVRGLLLFSTAARAITPLSATIKP
jgi:hypothetical protein